ncbi:MAG: restriction endonuclease [Candidatus Atribacteria bacterium]|nr:restriction endonuclease [Candidatus Atribacteria bacterium]
MAKIQSYKSFFSFNNVEEINDAFIKSLLSTNRTYDFFVNWEKVKANIEKFKVEIGILGTLTQSKNFDKDLEKILTEYPKTAKVLPLLVAMRDEKFDVLEDINKNQVYCFDCTKNLTQADIKKFIQFVKKSGIQDLFRTIRALNDYLLGVEVGLDSNARKNRSGSFMEKVVEEELQNISKELKDIEIFPKGRFGKLEERGVKVPKELQHRTPDFAIKKGSKLLSIEVNFYSGQGSKPQEIVDAYINRQRELQNSGWQFVWITDGNGWRQGQNQIRKAIEQMDFVLNINFIKKGFLKHILGEI